MLTSRINHVHIENFKSLANVDVDLTDLNVLVGVNGIGKSNFIDALRFVRDALSNGLGRAINARSRTPIFYYGMSGTKTDITRFSFDIMIEEVAGEYSFSVRGNGVIEEKCRLGTHFFRLEGGKLAESSLFSSEESSPLRNSDFTNLASSPFELLLPSMSGLSFLFPELRPVFTFFSTMKFYSIFPPALRQPQAQRTPPPLAEDGTNLNFILRNLLQTTQGPWRIQNISDALAAIVPNLSEQPPIIGVEQAGSYLIAYLTHRDEIRFELESESDGTLRALGILTALYQPGPVPLMTFEEPELMWHPHAAGTLCDVFREASVSRQIILTTHSPDLIARFKAENLRIVELVDGATKIGPLQEHQVQAINDQLFSGGDLLRIEGLKRE